MTPGPATPRPAPPGRPAPARDSGLVALEWLLIVALVAGLGASASVIVRRVVEDAAEVPADPLVRLLEADIAAVSVAAQAQSEYNDDPTADKTNYAARGARYRSRCEAGIRDDFGDVVALALWEGPTNSDSASCKVTPHRDLDG